MVRQLTGSSTVARQMQDRTHKGGAVLWFLRKHAPMPLPYASMVGDEEAAPTTAKSSSPDSTMAGAAAGGSVTQKPVSGPQRKFLHGTLQVIGAELDNQLDVEGDGFGNTPHPQGSRMDSQTAAWGARENLRRRYADHTDAELEQLEAAVQAKEQEVLALRKQVDQMERYLVSTRAAANRRSCRMREGSTDAERPTKTNVTTNIASQIVKTKKNFLSSAGAIVWDADDGVPRSPRENVIEEWQHSIMRQSEIAQSMRAHVDEQVKALQQQTIQRKAQEAQLFASHAVTLRLRAQAQQTEARVQRLANELRRIYQSLPETIRKKLSTDDGYATREHHKESELTALKVEHHSEFFKFLDTDSIQEESKTCQKRISEMEEHTVLAHRVLERGRWFGETGVQHARAARVAIDALHDRWARFAAAGHPAGELTLKDNPTDDADCILQRATLSVNALTELIDILHKGDPSNSREKVPIKMLRSCDTKVLEEDDSGSGSPQSKKEKALEAELPETLAMPWSL